MQDKANTVEEQCPDCHGSLCHKKRRVVRGVDAYCGKVKLLRFKDAIQRLDLYHANTYLWAVAHELHGAGTPEARRWVKPLLKQIRNDPVAHVITQWEDLTPRLGAAAAKAAGDAIEYYQNNQQRMKYKQARQRKEPVGSGAIESTCRQRQCRMKRCGQFWSTRGDEALLCLEMFWRNERWELLFPHAKLTAVSNN